MFKIRQTSIIKKLAKMNFLLILNIILIFIISLSTIYSSTLSKSSAFFKKEIIWFFIASFVFLVTSFIDYRKYQKYNIAIYFFNIMILLSVLAIGTTRLGAKRWIDLGPISLQPSEFSKILLIFTFSSFLLKYYDNKIIGFKALGITFAHVFPVFILIAIEPDLGTSLVIILIYGVLIFLNELDIKVILTMIISFIIFIPFSYRFLLKDYQKTRIITFLNPESDALGSGWNITQSKIAIGSGQLFGKGFLNNTQGKLRYLPESHTDFIGSVFLEERGFIGGVILLILYLCLLFQILGIADKASDKFGKYICYGITTIFFFHIFVNMGMIMGIMPVTGLPLLIMSYGGTSLVFSFFMLGVVQSVRIHKGAQ